MLTMKICKRDVLLWKSWGIFPQEAFTLGLKMHLPSGKVCEFVPCKQTRTPALKPIQSEGYREWVRTYNQTELIVEAEAREVPISTAHATTRLSEVMPR